MIKDTKKINKLLNKENKYNEDIKYDEYKKTIFKILPCENKDQVNKKILPYKKYHENALNKLKNKYTREKTQKRYAIDYMLENAGKMVKQGDLLSYCDKRRNKDTKGAKPNFKDNSRGIELLRKDILPHCWLEKREKGELYFIYLPELKELVSNEIIKTSKNRSKKFSKKTIKELLKKSNFTCELTGLPMSEGKLAADHWRPKEKGSKSDKNNCVMLNKILNEKKNNKEPVNWFIKSFMTNFLNICKRTGMNIKNVKEQLINFILEF